MAFLFDFNDIYKNVEEWIDNITGHTANVQNRKAQELAEQSQNFNEQYSKDSLAQQQQQFNQQMDIANRNIDWQKEIADKNLAFQQDAFSRQLQENEITRQREDTAYQRQIADLKAAGFSPLMASNGADAAAMSVGSAPQYDGSAVATAQGSALSLAQEYAALKNMAQGQYLTRKQEATNQRIGALMALADLSENRRVNMQNLALQSFNLSNAIKDSKAKRNLIDEQIQSSKQQRDWMDKHGYRNQNFWSIALPVVSDIAKSFGISQQKLTEAIADLPTKFANVISSTPSKEELQSAMPNYAPELQSKFSAAELQEVMMLSALGFELSDDDLNKTASFLYSRLPDNRKRYSSIDSVKNQIKNDGLKNFLAYAFGIK